MTDEPSITVSAGGFELPVVEVLTGRGALFGKSGSGKSNTLGVIAEELLSKGFPLCIVDADGEHYGLKEEYELLHVGGDESVDVQVGPEHAEQLAEVMLHDDVPVIIDISGYIEDDEADELVERVVSKLFSMEKKAKKPFPVFVEEVHEAVPETNSPDSLAKTLIRVAKRGRKHGLGICGASQRPAEVKKSLATQSSWSVWHKLTWSQDTKVVKEVIDKESAEAVQDLDTGEAIVMADWMTDPPRTIQFKQKATFDAGATPGLEEFTTPELKGVSDDVVESLRSITEEKEAEEAERDRLESEVERLQEEKAALEAEVEDLRSGDMVESEEVERLRKRVEALRDERDDLQDSVEKYEEKLEEVQYALEERRERIEELESQVDGIEDARTHLGEAMQSLGFPIDRDDVERDVSELRDRIEELESENERLRQNLEDAGGDILSEDAEYMDFIDHDAVQEAIEDAKSENTPKYVRGVVGAIIEEGGAVTYDDIADRLGLSQTNHVSSAATTLEEFGVVVKRDADNRGAKTAVDLNVGGIEKIVARKTKRERTENIMEKI